MEPLGIALILLLAEGTVGTGALLLVRCCSEVTTSGVGGRKIATKIR